MKGLPTLLTNNVPGSGLPLSNFGRWLARYSSNKGIKQLGSIPRTATPVFVSCARKWNCQKVSRGLVRSLSFTQSGVATWTSFGISDLKTFASEGVPIRHSRRLRCLHGSVMSHLSSNRSEEHTSELQSLRHLVCRLLL